MGALTEIEIFGCMAEGLRVSAEACGQLAWHPRRGPLYRRFLAAIDDAAGAADQAYYWRNWDARWLYISMQLRAIKDMTGRWLRDSATREARKVAHPMFVKLGNKLDELAQTAEIVKTAATGRLSPIQPEPEPLPELRVGRPVQVLSPGGVILP